jgi:lysozyme
VIRAAILAWRKPAEIISRRTAEADQFITPYSVSLPKARATDAAPIKLAA